MAAPLFETIWLINGFKSHIVMDAPYAFTAPSNVQNLMNSSSRRFDDKSRSLARVHLGSIPTRILTVLLSFTLYL